MRFPPPQWQRLVRVALSASYYGACFSGVGDLGQRELGAVPPPCTQGSVKENVMSPQEDKNTNQTAVNELDVSLLSPEYGSNCHEVPTRQALYSE